MSICSSVALAAAIVAANLHWPFPRRAPGIVEYKPLTVVRTTSAGFVDELMVDAGQFVRCGDVLAKLSNDALVEERRLVELSVEESKLRCRLYRQRGEMAKYQAEVEHLNNFQSQREQKETQVCGLTIVAAADGEVIGRNLSSLLGRYLEEGQEVCRIGQEGAKEIQLSIHQDDVESFQARIGSPVTVRGANGLLTATLSGISPRATDQATILSLCTPHGGPLPVRTAEENNNRESLQLLAPRFIGHVELGPETSRQLRAGQL
jgi:hypothetical protein